MALPTPIFVTPSTSVVEVNPLQSPYNPVLLNAVAFPGQVVTIRDATSSIQVLTSSIVVSTQAQTFADGSISTVINQPQGFITAQTLATNQWAFLNSFPFRNQYLSAGVQVLTTSTLFTAVTSTAQEYVSSLNVENLTVTGNFLQSEGITLNTNLSSLGTVEFVSSLSVWGNVYLSSYASVIGAVKLFSTLSVGTHLITNSTLRTLSSFFVSSGLMIIGGLSTPAIEFQDGLVGTNLSISSSSDRAIEIAGNTEIHGDLTLGSNLNVGGYCQTNTLSVAGTATILSSASLYANSFVYGTVSTTGTVSTAGSLEVSALLSTGHDLTVYDSIYVGKAGYIQDLLTIGSTLQTSTLRVTTLETSGDYANNSTIALISSVNVRGGLGIGYVNATRTEFSTTRVDSTLTVKGSALITGPLQIETNLSSLANSRTNYLYGLGDLRVGDYVSTNTVYPYTFLTVGESTITNSLSIYGLGNLNATTSVIADFYSYEDLVCDGILTISSIVLPSSLTANSFTADSLAVGSKAIASNVRISSLLTSSLTIGYIPTSEYRFDVSGSISVYALSTLLLSSKVQTVVESDFSRIWVQGGMGVRVEPPRSTFECQPIAYFPSSPVYAFSTVSTNYFVIKDTLQTALNGNAINMSNFQYPPTLSGFAVYVSSATIPYEGILTTSTIQTSTINAGSLFVRSSIQLGSFYIDGDARLRGSLVSGINLLQTIPENNALFVNGVKFTGEGTGDVTRRVTINGDTQISTGNGSYGETLNVWRTLGVSQFGTSRILDIDTLRSKKVLASTVYGYDGIASNYNTTFIGIGNTYIASGNISTASGKFFLGEGETYDSRFNIIQPYQSTLQFNSTMFLNRSISSVGINTQPNFSLDVKRLVAIGVTNGGDGSQIQNNITINPSYSTFYYAFNEADTTTSNVLYSSNAVTWSNFRSSEMATLEIEYNAYYSYGISRSNSANNTSFTEYSRLEYFLGTTFFPFNPTTPSGVIAESGFFYNLPLDNIYQLYSIDTARAMTADTLYKYAGGTNSPSQNAQTFLFRGDSTYGFFSFNLLFFSGALFQPGGGRSNGAYSMTIGGSTSPQPLLVGGFDGSLSSALWVSYTNGDSWSPIPTSYKEIRSVLPIQLDTGETYFFVAGGVYSAGSIINGGVQYQFEINLASACTEISTILFTGSGLCIATDGRRIVVGGEDTNGNTLYYHTIQGSNFTNGWTVCSGDLFPDRTNSVLWSGSKWVAGGDSGIRESYDGINWVDPNLSLTQEIFGLGYQSNAANMMVIGDSNKGIPLQFQDTPYLQMKNLANGPTISFNPSSILALNNACVLDSAQNMIMPGYLVTPSPLSQTPFTSTVYTRDAFVSTVFSTSKIEVGGYYLGFQTI